MKRKEERELIVLTLYMMELTGQNMVEALQTLNERFALDTPTSYMIRSIEGVITQEEMLDEIIARNLENYTIDRLSFIDRQILRFATYEMTLRDPDLAPAIIINEAIEICKKYSDLDDEKASAFVNRVLDKVKADLNV